MTQNKLPSRSSGSNSNSSESCKTPLAIFDAIEFVRHQAPPDGLSVHQIKDFDIALSFVNSYTGSRGTFNSYRREVERLLQYTWLVAELNLKDLKRDHIESHIRFCQNPPKSWVGLKKAVRFVEKDGFRTPNPEWRPFVATVSKSEFKNGKRPKKDDYELSDGAIKELMAILSSFFNFMLQEEYVESNPIALIRQKSKFVKKRQGPAKIRRLSEKQWQTVIQVAEDMANENPRVHERTLFIMSALYSMYLRISELSSNDRWSPTMNDFQRDHDGLWWFTTVGKGNKERQIAVSDSMLEALKRWRTHLGLTQLPSLSDDSPLVPRVRGKGATSNSTHIRSIVQDCFDRAIEQLRKDKFDLEADMLMDATVHWLRHTGISDDVKIRPREHVRDDAGHSSSAITDRYIDIELKERHRSAKRKTISS